jgi:hypothetical protein
MPRVTHVKRAQKDNPVCKAGEPYYWWKFRYGGKRYSLTPPRPSQLTQSAYYGTVRGLIEQISDYNAEEPSDLESLRDEVAGEIRQAGEECNDSKENMPEGLQEGDTGQMLEERYNECESAADELESMDFEFETELDLDDFKDEDIKPEDAQKEFDDAVKSETQDWMMEKQGEMSEFIEACDI